VAFVQLYFYAHRGKEKKARELLAKWLKPDKAGKTIGLLDAKIWGKDKGNDNNELYDIHVLRGDASAGKCRYTFVPSVIQRGIGGKIQEPEAWSPKDNGDEKFEQNRILDKYCCCRK
jgi:hypothetical protein